MTRAGPLLITLLPLAVALAVTGCDDAPTCGVTGNLGGAINGDVLWSLEGTDNCGIGDASSIAADSSALVFVARTPDTYRQLIVLVESPVLGVAEFPGQVLLVTPNNLWDSGAGACTVVLTNYTVEPWSRTDFVELEGIVDCPAPLISASGGEDIVLSTMGISGHVYDEPLSFDNI